MVDLDPPFVCALIDADAFGIPGNAANIVLMYSFAINVSLVFTVGYFRNHGISLTGDFPDNTADSENVILCSSILLAYFRTIIAVIYLKAAGRAIDKSDNSSQPVFAMILAVNPAEILTILDSYFRRSGITSSKDTSGADILVRRTICNRMVFYGD